MLDCPRTQSGREAHQSTCLHQPNLAACRTEVFSQALRSAVTGLAEPVFGIIKSVLGFRQFLLRGLDKVRGEWNLVTLAWNLKRMFALVPAK